ncbi:hypothetical protein AAZX31_02G049600 [Glycine max]
MRTTAPSDFIFTQKLHPFNITSTKTSLQRTLPYFLQLNRMAEAARTAHTPAPHPIQPKPDDKTPNPAKEIPPPPEKPEPGDCCGSGCVRCVWDVYYDELEEYNKRYKQVDPSPKPSS